MSLRTLPVVLAALGGADTPLRQQLMGLLGAGARYGVLMPYARSQESEADVLGLDLMARAGFDPSQSVELWRNMSPRAGSGPPAFLSTHPSTGDRIETLQRNMPGAMQIYEAARQAGRSPACG